MATVAGTVLYKCRLF